MKNTFIYLFAIFFTIIGCKNEVEIKNKKSDLVKSDTLNNITKKELDCGEIILEIVKSSNLNLKDYKDYFVRIDGIKNDSISIQVYFENNLSDNPKEKQIVESTIAWLLFLPNEKKLLNVTADPENPIQLKYNFNDLNSVYKYCNISKKEIENTAEVLDKDKECKTITVEMGKGQECQIKNATIETVYDNIIKNKEVDDFKYLLKSLPRKTKTIEINKNGLINIKYNVKQDKINIVFSYDGGVTEIDIEQVDSNVLKRIVYYAD
jgi:hypothetical protein